MPTLRQQDGWTVLAPPPAVEGDLPPPPYASEAALVVPVAPAAPSNIIGAAPASRTTSFARDASFAVAFLDICNMMRVDPSMARIGFKWDNEKASQGTHVLANATDWENCLTSGFGQQKRAKTRTVVCMIKNMNLAMDTAQWVPNPPSHATTGKKRKSPGSSSGPAIRTPECTEEYRELKAKLKCSTHKDQLCFVSTADGHHVRIEPFNVALWAKEILLGTATLTRPPENIVFQDGFMPSRKRPRVASSTSSNPLVPTIHVTVNTGGSNTPPPRRSPLPNITNNIDTPPPPPLSELNAALTRSAINGSSRFFNSLTMTGYSKTQLSSLSPLSYLSTCCTSSVSPMLIRSFCWKRTFMFSRGSVLSGTIKKQQVSHAATQQNFHGAPEIKLSRSINDRPGSANSYSPAKRGRETVSKPPADPKKLAAWGISGDQTDPLYLLQQLRKHVPFRSKEGKLLTAIAPLEEAFNAITEIIFQTLTEQTAEMVRLTTAEQSSKSHVPPDLESLKKSLAEQIDASTNYIANLIITPPTQDPHSQTQRPSHHPASYSGAVQKPGSLSLGNRDNVTERAPISEAARKFQITLTHHKSSASSTKPSQTR
ncbi:hypothetical protein C8J57DRAFT_1256754 [Mycena rebaudengoi]|nr:hypothetical protein C8J57DRAFT_1256754 [Mycena rebaudengoi]